MNRSILTVIAFVAAVAAAAPAAALNPIDDFEIGSFALWTSRNNNCVSDTMLLSWYEPHVISQVRIVTVCGIGDEPCTASLTTGSLDDNILFTAGGNPTDFLRINYNWGFPRTLTYGGVLNRIELDLKQGLPGGTIAIAIWDASGADYVVRDATAPGILTFPLSEFESVDVNAAMRIEVDIESSYETGAFQVADIRLRGDGYWGPAQPVDFVGDFVAIDWPPLPSPPLSWRMTDPEGNWLYRTGMVITRSDDGGVINPCFHADWSEAAALGGEIGGVSFMGIDPQPMIDTNFELTVDLDTAIRLGPIPQIIGEPSLTASPFGFLITFPVMLTDAAGNEIGRSETRILFDVHEGQLLTMENVTLAPGGGAMPGWTNGFVLAFTMDVIDVVDLEEPLFEATWIADWSPLSVTGIDAPDASGAAAPAPTNAIVLTAWPSVTRGAAEIRASIPFAADGSIEIHDVSGRLVRTLAAQRGAPSVRWDGRDDRGQLTASGPFFAHLAGASSRPTRIVRLR